MKTGSEHRFCAFCRSERVVYVKRRLSLADAGLSAVGSIALSFIIWQSLDARALAIFGVAIGAAEFFIIVRRRLSVPCPRCGFDAVLYRRDKDAASERVKRRLEARKDDPAAWLSPLPKIPVRIKKMDRTSRVPKIRPGGPPVSGSPVSGPPSVSN